MIEEILYTSAQSGLKPGSRGFCTVQSTHGMALNTAERLESMSGYRHAFPLHDPQASLNPISYSHMTLRIGGKPVHVISRVADYGHDYSGRTNKLAHHIVLDPAAMALAGPARLMQHPGTLTAEWNGSVSNIPPRSLPVPDLPTTVRLTAWNSLTGDSGWAGWAAEALQAEQSPLSVIFAPGTDTLALVQEILDLLPPQQRWDYTFSTYFTKALAGTTCQLRFILDRTPEATTLRNDARARLIDLTTTHAAARGGVLVTLARGSIAHAVAPPPVPAAAMNTPPTAPRNAPALPAAAGHPVPGAAPAIPQPGVTPFIDVGDTGPFSARRQRRKGSRFRHLRTVLVLIAGIAAGYFFATSKSTLIPERQLPAETTAKDSRDSVPARPKAGTSGQQRPNDSATLSQEDTVLADAGTVPQMETSAVPDPDALQAPQIPPLVDPNAAGSPDAAAPLKPAMEPSATEKPTPPPPPPRSAPFQLALKSPQHTDAHGQLRAILPDPGAPTTAFLPLICQQDRPEITIRPFRSFLEAITTCCNGVKVDYRQTAPDSWAVFLSDATPPTTQVAQVKLQRNEDTSAAESHRLVFSWSDTAPDRALAAVVRWCPVEITLEGDTQVCLLAAPARIPAVAAADLLQQRYEQNEHFEGIFSCVSFLQLAPAYPAQATLQFHSAGSTHSFTLPLTDGRAELPVLACDRTGRIFPFDPTAAPPVADNAFATLQCTVSREEPDAPDGRFLLEPRWDAIIRALGVLRMQQLDLEARRQARNRKASGPLILEQIAQLPEFPDTNVKKISAIELQSHQSSYQQLSQRLLQVQQLSNVKYWSREELKQSPILDRRLQEVTKAMQSLQPRLRQSSDNAHALEDRYSRELRDAKEESDQQRLQKDLNTVSAIKRTLAQMQDLTEKLLAEEKQEADLEASISLLHRVASEIRIQLHIHADFISDTGITTRVDFLESTAAGEQP